jgi:hypothetical protein
LSTSIQDRDLVILPDRRRADRIAPRAAIRIGRVVSAIPVVFLLFDATNKLLLFQPVLDGMNTLGYPSSLVRMIGILLVACLLLYMIPQTAVLGAILLTGYLGGAVASQVRVDLPLLTDVLVPVYAGVLVWAGLYLREPRLRRLVPFRAPTR